MPTGHSAQEAMEWRRHEVERNQQMTVKHSIVEGVCEVIGDGEAMAVIDFPILFVERPVFTCGHELGENISPVPGSFPSASATVATWIYLERSKTQRYWQGANLAVRITGSGTGSSYLHFHFSGKAFRNPVLGDTGPTDTL